MRVLIDTDIVLDILLGREPFAQHSVQVLKLHEQGRIDAYIAAITPINVFYITRKLKGAEVARRAVELLLMSLAVCPLSLAVRHDAHKLPFTDYEDAVQYASAIASGIETIVTRDIDDYKNASLPVLSPTEFLKKLELQQT